MKSVMDRIEFTPRVLPIKCECEVVAELPPELALSEKIHVRVWAMEGIPEGRLELPDGSTIIEGLTLRLKLRLPAEQEYHVELRSRLAEDNDRCIARGRVYGLKPDLSGLRPFKGDFHMHSVRSDGQDVPSEVAVASRRTGLDFMALTDHRLYEPSLEAMQPFKGLEVGLSMFPGEEIHPPGNPVHMINFGGSSSVNALFDGEAYQKGVADIAAGLDGLRRDERRDQYASCLWCYDKIRELGGIGVFCHPYWNCGGHYNVCEELMVRHFQDRAFDAYEVIGGYDTHEYASNTLQIARYHEERLQDANLPVVGASDAHGCNVDKLFGWYYTIIFSPSCALGDIASAVRELRSVAVAVLPGRAPEVVGPHRLVKLAMFLMREYMPGHDSICAEDSEAMNRLLAGDEDAPADLLEFRRKLSDYHESVWH